MNSLIVSTNKTCSILHETVDRVFNAQKGFLQIFVFGKSHFAVFDFFGMAIL
jgi:hypothetical protein